MTRRISLERRLTNEEIVLILDGAGWEEVRNSFPTWPLEIMPLHALVILLILPVLIAVLPSLINLFTKQ